MNTNRALFGELLRDWRLETLQLTLDEFVKRLNSYGFSYSTSAIARYERGERKPHGDFFVHLSITFDLPRDEAMSWLKALSVEYLIDLQEEYTAAMQKWITKT